MDYVQPRRTGCSPLAMIAAACCGCLVIGLIVAGGLGLLGYKAVQEATKPGVPPPPAYVGTWRSADGTQTLIIRSDGHGAYDRHSGSATGHSDVHIDGGPVTVDQARREISITFFGLGEHFRLDQPPHPANGGTAMTLDGTVFRKVGPPTAPPPGRSPRSGGASGTQTL